MSTCLKIGDWMMFGWRVWARKKRESFAEDAEVLAKKKSMNVIKK
jgi:predicted negative regulator of RcsB-dependent stress response